MLDLEEEGKLNMTVRLKKRALQGAYDQAIKKKKVCDHAIHAFSLISDKCTGLDVCVVTAMHKL